MTSPTAEDLDEVRGEIAGARTSLDRVGDRQWWIVVALGVIAVLLALLTTAVIVATVRFSASDQAIRTAVRNNNQLLCPTIRQLASTDPPRTTAAGRASQEEFARIMRSPEYNC